MGDCVASRESTLLSASAINLSSGKLSPSTKARAAASVSRTVACAGEPPNMTMANALALAVKRMDRPACKRTRAGNGRARSHSSAGAICSIELPGIARHCAARSQARLNLSRVAGA
jgi:hypothetical protein